MKHVLIVLYSSLMLFTTCKKYPEGGFTKRGPKNIIGGWKLTLYEVNGIDSTDLINYNNEEEYKMVSFQKNVSTVSLSAPHSGASSVSFSENNQKLVFTNSTILPGIDCSVYRNVNYCYRSFFIPEGTHNAIWSIERLNKEQIKLSLILQHTYRIILSKK